MLKNIKYLLRIRKVMLLKLISVIQIWKLDVITQKEEKTLGLDIIVITQAHAGRRDTGRVEPGQESQYQKWFNYE